MVHVLNGLLHGVFGLIAVIWVAMALRTKRTVARGRGLWPIVAVSFAAFVIARAALPSATWARRLWAPGAPVSAVALILGAAGAAFAIWARVTIAGNWSGAIVLKADHQLVTSGPYALARHPIYTGFFAMFAAEVLVDPQVATLVALTLATVGLLVKSRAEERLMEASFPDQYPAYRARVKAIIPFVA